MSIKGREAAKVVVGLDFVAKGQSLGKATKQIENQLVQLQRRSASVGKQMGAIIPAFAATGAAAFSAYRFAIQQAVQFEDSFAGIKKTLNFVDTATVKSADRFENLSNEIRNIAKTTPIATNELNKIGEIGGQLGIEAKNIGSFIGTISKLTVATTMGAEDAAFAISRLANITSTAEKDIDNLASVLVRLGNEFAATESEIINTSLGIATAMTALESEFSNAAVDSLALATALKAVGVQSQSGATAIQRALDKMGSAVAAGGRELSLFADLAGMTTVAFRDLAKVDPARAFLRFLDGIRSISVQGADTVNILKELGLQQQRTVRALRALAFASEDVERALSTANEEFALNTALLTEAEKRFETTSSQLAILRNNIQDIGLELGQGTLPAINNVIDGLTNISKSLDEDSVQGTIRGIGLMTTAMFTLRAAIKNIISDFEMIPGTALEGGSSIIGDIFGVESMAGPRAKAQIEKLREEFKNIIEKDFAITEKSVLADDPHQAEAMRKAFDQLREDTQDGLEFLDVGGLTGKLPATVTNDLFSAMLESQGFDTTQINALLDQAAREGLDLFGAMLDDADELTEIDERVLELKNQITEEITNQVNASEQLNNAVLERLDAEDKVVELEERLSGAAERRRTAFENINDEIMESQIQLTLFEDEMENLVKQQGEMTPDVFKEQRESIQSSIDGLKEHIKVLETRQQLLTGEIEPEDLLEQVGLDPESIKNAELDLANLKEAVETTLSFGDITSGKQTLVDAVIPMKTGTGGAVSNPPISQALNDMISKNAQSFNRATTQLERYKEMLTEVTSEINQLAALRDSEEHRFRAKDAERLSNLEAQRRELSQNIEVLKQNLDNIEKLDVGLNQINDEISRLQTLGTEKMVENVEKYNNAIEQTVAIEKSKVEAIENTNNELRQSFALNQKNIEALEQQSIRNAKDAIDKLPGSPKAKQFAEEQAILDTMEDQLDQEEKKQNLKKARIESLDKEIKKQKEILNTAGKHNKIEAERLLMEKTQEREKLILDNKEIAEKIDDQNDLITAQKGKINEILKDLNIEKKQIDEINLAQRAINDEIEKNNKKIESHKQQINKLESQRLNFETEAKKINDELVEKTRKLLQDERSLRLERFRAMEGELNTLRDIYKEELAILEVDTEDVELLREKQNLLSSLKDEIAEMADAGTITEPQAQNLVNQLNNEFLMGGISPTGEQLKPSEMFDDEVLKKKPRRLKLPTISPATKEAYKAVREEINKMDTGLIGLGNRFQKTTKLNGKLGSNFKLLAHQIGMVLKGIGLLRQKELRNLEMQMFRNEKLTKRLRNAFQRLTKIINGVGMAVKGLVANFAVMAGFMAIMTTAFKMMENASKSTAAIEAMRDSLDGLFEDATTREGLKAQRNELQKLLEEYEAKGPEFENVVEAIKTRMEDVENSLREANNVFDEQMAEIGSTLLFDTTVDDNIGDLEKRIPAIAKFIGADAELLINRITEEIGKEIADATVDASPRDLVEALVDVESFEQGTRDVFGALLEGFEDDSSLVYDPTVPYKNFFKTSQKELIDFFDKEGDLGQIAGEGMIFGSDPTSQFKIADKITGFFTGGFDKQFADNMQSNFDDIKFDFDPTGGITVSRTSMNGFREEVIAEINSELFEKLADDMSDEQLMKRFGTTDAKKAGDLMLRNFIGDISTEEGRKQFEKEFTSMLVLGRNIIAQSMTEQKDTGTTLIAEMQNQALLSELRQFQNQGIIDTILDPQKNRIAAERQLEHARAVAREAEVEKAKKLRDELDLADFAADKFSETIKKNLVGSAEKIMDVFGEVPKQIKKSMKKIVEELIVKQALQKNFENQIKRLANVAPLLAEQLSKQGPAASQVVADFLNDRTGALIAEGALQNVIPEFAAEIGVEKNVADDLKDQAIDIGSALADGLLIGLHNRGAISLPDAMVNMINDAIFAAAGPDGADTGSPSRKTERLIGQPMLDGIISPFADPERIKEVMSRSVGIAIKKTAEELEPTLKGLYSTFEQASSEIEEAFSALFGFTSAQRALVQANYAVQKSEQALMATRRSQATLGERILKNQIELQKLEVEGRKGNITGAEELSILKQKVALQDMLDKAQGNRSASERLAIANAEEELEKLTLAAEAGIVGALEVEVAEENLKQLKGEDLTEDEQRIVVLELAEAEKALQKTEDKAKETSEELVSTREKHVTLLDEQANASYELEIAYDNLEAATEGVYQAELKYEQAREVLREFADSAGKEVFDKIIEGYGGVGSEIDTIVTKTIGLAQTTETEMAKATDSVREYLSALALMEQNKIIDTPGIDDVGQALAQKENQSFSSFLDTFFGGAKQFRAEAMGRAQRGQFDIEQSFASGQFRDDEEMNLAALAAQDISGQNLYNVDNLKPDRVRTFEGIRALEGLFGIPFSIFDSGQIATSLEALEAADLGYLAGELRNAGINIYDTSKKLAEAEAGDYSRNVTSGTKTAGYIPSIGSTQAGKSTKIIMTDLNTLLQAIPPTNPVTGANQSALRVAGSQFGLLNIDPAMYNYFKGQAVPGIFNSLSASEKNRTRGYFDGLAMKVKNLLDDLGITNADVLRGFKYGGYMKPFQRALVGEYGPEMVQAVGKGGLRVTPQGSERSGSINVENVNVQVTGVPSDPIQARKAAQQIQKALVNLGKEGSVGTGLRRN
tara:strand:+ start:1438 stop:9426 length:7989 start_codon:yes stop_codon:yes gene_type:complete